MTSQEESKYSEILEELSQLATFANEVSARTQGRPVTNQSNEWASYIFAKICVHVISLQKLVPTGLAPVRSGFTEIWDISSICTLVRVIIDAFFSMYYIAAENISEKERIFRTCLWNYHSEKHRLDMLRHIRSTSPKLKNLTDQVKQLKEELERNPIYPTLDSELKRKSRKGNLALHLTNSELSERSKINPGYYKAAYSFLSSYIHTYPFSLSQLQQFRAGNPDSLHLISTALNYCVIFLSITIRDFVRLFPDQEKFMPTEIEEIIKKWEFIIENIGGNPTSE